METKSQTYSRLLRAHRAGDPSARDQLLRELEPVILGQTKKYKKALGDDAYQIAQVAAIEAIDHPRIDPERGGVGTYVYFLIGNALRDALAKSSVVELTSDEYRKKKRIKSAPIDDVFDISAPEERPDVKRDRAALIAAIDAAGLDARELRMLAGVLRSEALGVAAAEFGVTRERVRQIRDSGLRKMRAELERRGLRGFDEFDSA